DGKSFDKIFTNKKQDISDEFINANLQEIDRCGDLLEKNPYMKYYEQYAACIKKFLESLLPNAFSIGLSYSAPTASNFKKKEYQVVKVIDKELKSLLAYVKEKEKKHLQIADSVAVIKGLLLDVLR
ncbi:MAG TPA: DUF327 family protein, partial [Spirochaetota bacterium]|nr:DUF327 family protein [Spirochaetota bacterium]